MRLRSDEYPLSLSSTESPASLKVMRTSKWCQSEHVWLNCAFKQLKWSQNENESQVGSVVNQSSELVFVKWVSRMESQLVSSCFLSVVSLICWVACVLGEGVIKRASTRSSRGSRSCLVFVTASGNAPLELLVSPCLCVSAHISFQMLRPSAVCKLCLAAC